MAVTLNAPGVYIQEVPSGARTIGGVSTSVTAFVGRCLRGDISADRAPIRVGSWADFERSFGGLWPSSELPTAVYQYFQAGGSTALIVRVVHSGDAVAINNATRGEYDLQGGWVLTASSPGAWSDLVITVSYGGVLDATDAESFHLSVTQTSTGDSKEFRFVSINPGSPRYVVPLLATRSRWLRVQSSGAAVPSDVALVLVIPGRDGVEPTDTEMEDALLRLEHADTVNMLCIPPYDALASTPAASVYLAASRLCEGLRAILLVDPDWGNPQDAAAMAGFPAFISANAVMMYPAVRAADPNRDGLERTFAPSPFFAGTIARTDAARGVWKAPAGLDASLRGATGVERPLTEDEVGQLNQRGVNALVHRPLVGPVIWGSRTSVGADTRASEWMYLPVRRLALYIEESLFRGLQWAVFEGNDEPLWGQIRGAVTTFMQRLFNQGAFAGSSVREAFSVTCDADTTTPDDVARGVVNILVAFAPLKPAEFVVLKFQQMAGQSGT